VLEQVIKLNHLIQALAQVVIHKQTLTGVVNTGWIDRLLGVTVHSLGLRVQAMAHMDVKEVVPLDERQLTGHHVNPILRNDKVPLERQRTRVLCP